MSDAYSAMMIATSRTNDSLSSANSLYSLPEQQNYPKRRDEILLADEETEEGRRLSQDVSHLCELRRNSGRVLSRLSSHDGSSARKPLAIGF